MVETAWGQARRGSDRPVDTDRSRRSWPAPTDVRLSGHRRLSGAKCVPLPGPGLVFKGLLARRLRVSLDVHYI
ncbi:hypothetical protein ColLi_11568 [Colletotrichum liriopes]|uniref:Uncharacterized protein n=1 Tax=Colletotrichum liriopes TaxID=708192 RepID=A0AA37GWQ8_9PEZI|nr:hypothetical protein ColLi_11568 [Colletotrichum liriopes]